MLFNIKNYTICTVLKSLTRTLTIFSMTQTISYHSKRTNVTALKSTTCTRSRLCVVEEICLLI